MRKDKHNTLYIVVIISIITISLGFISLINVSALSYQAKTGVSFTFEPTLSINLSSSDLVISNLVPGSSSDSNSINVSVATNAAYGYNLSANVGNSTYNNTNLTSKYNNVFTNIPTTANLSSLDTDNTWGYSYSLDNGSSWSSYNGLPLYSSNDSKTLVDKYSQSEDMVNFKIAAKASSTQPSGIYSNVINFNVISYASPMSLSDSYAYFGKELYHGYYKMQDMTTRICQTAETPSELQVIDIRDDKVYWIAKLADNNCWMTQNLDLDLISDPEADNYVALTSENTDLNDTTSAAYQDGYTVNENGIITWVPSNATIDFTGSTVKGWRDSTSSFSANKTDNTEIGHNSLGNYYNWSASIASNQGSLFAASTYDNSFANPLNSICSKNWRLPIVSSGSDSELDNLAALYTILTIPPTWFMPSGDINGGVLYSLGSYGNYWSSTVNNNDLAYYLVIDDGHGWTSYTYGKVGGFSIRCLAR